MKSLLSVLSGNASEPPPIWLMRQAGRYLPEYRATREKAGGFLDLCFNPELATEVTLQPIRRFGFDASILFSDILVIPHGLGQKVWFAVGEGPRLEPISTIDELGDTGSEIALERLSPVIETVSRLHQSLPAETTLIGFCGAPWTVASYMVAGRGTPDLAPIRTFAAEAPVKLQGIIDRLVEVSIDYLLAQVRAGAEVLQIFESWAQVLRGDDFKRWSFDPVSRIVDGVKARSPETPIIVFPRKAALEGYSAVAQLEGVAGVSIDSDFDLNIAAEKLQPFAAVQGNLDPQDLVAGPESIDPKVDAMKAALSAGPWVANLGHGIVPETPIAHVEHFIRRIREG
ncbi:MAG: uroporphyrinogen decarboxylase [Pseudomonadota bacterium]